MTAVEKLVINESSGDDDFSPAQADALDFLSRVHGQSGQPLRNSRHLYAGDCQPLPASVLAQMAGRGSQGRGGSSGPHTPLLSSAHDTTRDPAYFPRAKTRHAPYFAPYVC